MDLRPRLAPPPSPQDVLVGAIVLMRHTHHPERGKPRFGDYCDLYRARRLEGLSHLQTIVAMDALESF